MENSHREVCPKRTLPFVGDRERSRRMTAVRVVVSVAGLVAGLALLSGCRSSVDLEVAGMLDRAQRTFDQAETKDDFLRAAGEYQAVLDRGVISGAVLFNQGNAYMRADQRGRAIASYRQAKRYRPRDPYLDANLRSALGGAGPLPQRRVVDFLLFWQDWVSYPGKFQLTAGVALVSFLFGVAAVLGRQRWCGHVALGFLAVTALFALSAGYDWYRYDVISHGVVVEYEVVARKGYATSYEPAFTEPLKEGTEFELLEQRGGWVSIRLPGGEECWIEASSAELY
jgi:uncharacterized membrane protein YphA (DoxX/SURF4 family)